MTADEISVKGLVHHRYSLVREGSGQLIAVASGGGRGGFLVCDEEGKFAQARFPDEREGEAMARFSEVRDAGKGAARFPAILARGTVDEATFCVTSVPEGEPLARWFGRTGALPLEVASRLVLDFVRALRESPGLSEGFAIAAEALWIEKTPAQPRVVVGEIATSGRSDSEEANARLCLGLLRYLTGNADSEDLRAILQSDYRGRLNLKIVEDRLDRYVSGHASPNFWTDYNKPVSVLHEAAAHLRASVTPPTIEAGYHDERHFPAIPAWSILVGAAVCLLLYQSVRLALVEDEHAIAELPLPLPYGEVVRAQFPGAAESSPTPMLAPSRRTAPVLRSAAPLPPAIPVEMVADRPEIRPVSSPATLMLAPSERAPGFARPVRSVPASFMAEAPVYPFFTPLQPGNERGLAGRILDLFGAMRSIVQGEKHIIMEFAAVDEHSFRGSNRSFGEAEEDEALIRARVVQREESAHRARQSGDRLEAIRHEVELLEMAPEMVEARMRLHEDLLELLSRETLELTVEQIAVIDRAADLNPKANEVLVRILDGR